MRSDPKASLPASPRRSARRATIALAGAIASMLLLVGSATAASGVTHPFLFSFTGAGTPGGSLNADSLAVGESVGRLYVLDAANESVKVFNASTGEYLSQITGSATPEGYFEWLNGHYGGVAVDNSGGPTDGTIYVATCITKSTTCGNAGAEGAVDVFSSTGTYLSQIDGSETPDGFFAGAPTDLTVDGSGNLYVADASSGGSDAIEHDVIDKFDSSGNYLSQISDPHLVSPAGVAVDSAGRIYVYNHFRHDVVRFSAAGAFQAVIDNDRPTGVAVDRTTDDLYVNKEGRVAIRDSSGALRNFFGSDHPGLKGIALDNATGRVYVSEKDTVNAFGPAEAVTLPDATIEATDEIAYFDATFHGVVNPQGVPTSYHFEYRQQGASGTQGEWRSTAEQSAGSGTEDLEVSATVNDLQKNLPFGQLADGKSYDVRLIATSTAADASSLSAGLDSFATLPVPPPGPVVDQPTTFTATTAHLSGTITNPSPGFETTYRFQYSTDGVDWTDGPAGSLGSSPGEVAVEGDIADLVPNSEYFVRLRATNPGGTVTSSTKSFTTAPAPPSQVETIPPGLIEETSARLGGWVNPNHSPTKYWFEYGPEDCASNPCASFPASEDADAGSGVASSIVTQDITGLEPNTTYHYRIVAENAAGAVVGNGIVFTTDDPNAPGPPDRGFELVNNPDKGNQPVFGSLFGDGSEVLWRVKAGSPGSPSSIVSNFKAMRTATGWQSRSALPPADQLLGDGVKPYIAVSVSTDGTRILYTLNSFSDLSPEITLVNTKTGAQQFLGKITRTKPSDQIPVVLADAVISQVYASDTRQELAAGDNDGVFDLYAYDEATSSWQVAGIRPDGSDPRCPVAPAAHSYEGLTSAGLLDYPETSAGTSGEKRIFFLATPTDDCSEPREIFVRDLTTETTTAVSMPALAGGQQRDTTFIRTNEDASAALFVTKTKLDSADENSSVDVYRWSATAGKECITCIVPEAAVGEAMASPDLSYVYFTSAVDLVAGWGLNSANSLYVLHEGEVDYIGPFSLGQSTSLGRGSQYAEVSADGSVALFKSGSPGATADSHAAGQVFRYDAIARELQCVSCPISLTGKGQLRNVVSDIDGVPVHGGDAVLGQIVFETPDPLSPRDVNGSPDIYEWRSGRTRLITDGVTEFPEEGEGRLTLYGISADAGNVLFKAGVQLTGHELDHTSNLYVARAGGGFPPPAQPPAPCQEDSCQGPLVAPPPGDGIGSASFVGPGNASAAPLRCRRGQRKVRRHGRVRCTSKRHQRAGTGKQRQGRQR